MKRTDKEPAAAEQTAFNDNFLNADYLQNAYGANPAEAEELVRFNTNFAVIIDLLPVGSAFPPPEFVLKAMRGEEKFSINVTALKSSLPSSTTIEQAQALGVVFAFLGKYSTNYDLVAEYIRQQTQSTVTLPDDSLDKFDSQKDYGAGDLELEYLKKIYERVKIISPILPEAKFPTVQGMLRVFRGEAKFTANQNAQLPDYATVEQREAFGYLKATFEFLDEQNKVFRSFCKEKSKIQSIKEELLYLKDKVSDMFGGAAGGGAHGDTPEAQQEEGAAPDVDAAGESVAADKTDDAGSA